MVEANDTLTVTDGDTTEDCTVLEGRDPTGIGQNVSQVNK